MKALDCPFTGNTEKTTVVAAKAGIHKALERSLDCRFRGNDEMLMRAVRHLPSVRDACDSFSRLIAPLPGVPQTIERISNWCTSAAGRVAAHGGVARRLCGSPHGAPPALLAAAALHSPVSATSIVDQNNPTYQDGFCFTNAGFSCGQSFQQDHSNISGAGIFIDPNFQGGGNGTLTLSIFNTYNPVPSGLIASGTASNVDSNSGWVDVFWTPVVVSTAIQYYLVVESTNLILASYSQSSYLDGNALFSGSDYSGYDLTFRTFADNGAVQVPEPGSLGLFAIGIAGLGFALRRKAANNKRAA